MKRALLGRILEQPPVVGTVATALPRVLAERLQKRLAVLSDRCGIRPSPGPVRGPSRLRESFTGAGPVHRRRKVRRSRPSVIPSIARSAESRPSQPRGPARNRAAGSPAIAATSPPQIALPRVSAPNMTVTYIASPRPRTHSGNATWAETFRVDKATVHDAPATRLAANRRHGVMGERKQSGRCGGRDSGRRQQPVRVQACFQPRQRERTGHRRGSMAPSSVPYNAGPPAI